MTTKQETGQLGEDLASAYFVERGYQLLFRNWRHKNWEIDLIAVKGPVLHIIEVKAKSHNRFGYPEDEVDKKKLQTLICAAEEFLYLYPKWQRLQFDILAITLGPPIEYFLLEDVYL